MAFLRLGNVTVLVDVNGQQCDGRTDDILGMEPLVDKFTALLMVEQGLGGRLIKVSVGDRYLQGASMPWLMENYGIGASSLVGAAETLAGRTLGLTEDRVARTPTTSSARTRWKHSDPIATDRAPVGRCSVERNRRRRAQSSAPSAIVGAGEPFNDPHPVVVLVSYRNLLTWPSSRRGPTRSGSVHRPLTRCGQPFASDA